MRIWNNLENGNYSDAFRGGTTAVKKWIRIIKYLFIFAMLFLILEKLITYFFMQGERLGDDEYVKPYYIDKEEIRVFLKDRSYKDYKVMSYGRNEGFSYVLHLADSQTGKTMLCGRSYEKGDEKQKYLQFRCGGALANDHNQWYYYVLNEDLNSLDYIDKEENVLKFKDTRFRVLRYTRYSKEHSKKYNEYRSYFLKDIDNKSYVECIQTYSKSANFSCKYTLGKRNGMYNDAFTVENFVFKVSK